MSEDDQSAFEALARDVAQALQRGQTLLTELRELDPRLRDPASEASTRQLMRQLRDAMDDFERQLKLQQNRETRL